MLSLLDVILVYDLEVNPQKSKYHVCVCVDENLFFRINTASWWHPSFLITTKDNPFLRHDSHVQCILLEHDDYIIHESCIRHGIIGKLHPKHIDDIIHALLNNKTISVKRRQKIIDGLNASRKSLNNL